MNAQEQAGSGDGRADFVSIGDLRRMLEGWRRSGVKWLEQVDLDVTATVRQPASPDKTGVSAPSISAQTHPDLGTTKSVANAAHSAADVVRVATHSDSLPKISEQKDESVAARKAKASVQPDPVIPNPVACANRGERVEALADLAARVAKCRRCQELAETRTQTVFGVGNPEARIMFIGEAPGADEDRQGIPFVGRAGQLLDKIIEASQLRRDDLYICNILRCRPPGNRNPSPVEAGNCREFLDGQIAIVQPEYIVCWGTVAAQNLLNTTLTIGKLRQQFFEFGQARVLCTYHPSYLLRNPPAKKSVWDDMKLLMHELGVELK